MKKNYLYEVRGVGTNGVEEFKNRREAERFARAVVSESGDGFRLSVWAARLVGLPSDESSYLDGWREVTTYAVAGGHVSVTRV